MSEFTLKQKLDMWQRAAIGEAPTNVTITPEYVVELHNDVKELYDRIAELEALVERLIETGKQSMNFTEGFCNNADRDKPEYWHNWNAIVAEYKECER